MTVERVPADGSAGGPDRRGRTPGAGRARSARPPRSGPARGRNAEVTRSEIVKAAARHFARSGYAHVTLQEIAADADVTPALVIRYFGSKRALFETVATSDFEFDETLPDTAAELARFFITYWQDVQVRTPSVALLRSMDLDHGQLFYAEFKRRVLDRWRDRLQGRADAEATVRLMAGVSMGAGLFGIGALFDDPDLELSPADIKLMERKLELMIEACLAE